ncbi:SDR family NAD(P)-dependent oxidoreductase [Bacillus timonensis]|uniref:SDR family NAD(P)-dependent oxidoreductase n=1 Tax=Bacillus timonensis TaxID=1033734 RepID=UPI0002895F74|nr:SDR family NAD(P)-dependent oxidoreductase [Bacillus timonensis]
MFSLKGKTILITGATSGIGRETALLLHELGANLILLGRNKEHLERLKNLMPNQKTIGFEMNQIEKIVNLLKDISKEYGELHGLVHAAGIHKITPLRTVSISKTRELFSTNIETTIQLLKACSNKKVMSDGGSVVLLSSSSGMVGEPGIVAYSATKGAVISITKSSAMELAKRNIRVNCLAPGIVDTPMSKSIYEKIGRDQWELIKGQHPLGLGRPEYIAYPIAFLLSEGSKWITGTVIPVDGGYTAH